VSASEAEGRPFESGRARQIFLQFDVRVHVQRNLFASCSHSGTESLHDARMLCEALRFVASIGIFLQRRADEFIAGTFYCIEPTCAKFMQENWHRNFPIAFHRVRIVIAQ
jgi:hypothetical protein